MRMKHPLRRWREKQGMTLDEFAGRLQISPGFVSMVERDQRGLSLVMAARLSNETGIPLEDFVREPA